MCRRFAARRIAVVCCGVALASLCAAGSRHRVHPAHFRARAGGIWVELFGVRMRATVHSGFLRPSGRAFTSEERYWQANDCLKFLEDVEPLGSLPGLILGMAGELESLADIDLLRRYQRGDISALAELARRYELHLLGLASGLLDGRQDLARDCVQDCWLRVIKYGKGFDGRASFKTWLYRMVINRSRDLRERHKVVSLNGVPGRGDGAAPHAKEASWSSDAMAMAGPVGVDGANDVVDAEAIRRAVGRLSEGARLIVLLCYHRGMTHEVAAEILGIPVGTLKSRLHAGLGELREWMGAKDVA